MADGNDRPEAKHQASAGYTMHPYYYQQYYAAQQMAGAGYVPMMAPMSQQQMAAAAAAYGWQQYPGGYVAAMPMMQGAQPGQMPAYYFPYGHPAYAQYQQQYAYQMAQQQATASAKSSGVITESNKEPAQSSSGHSSENTPAEPVPGPPSVPSSESSSPHSSGTHLPPRAISRTSSSEAMDPIPLVRKISKGFPKDKSKWRLSRTGSKPSLALDGTGGDEDEDWDLPSSPLMGRKHSYSVSPRHCGSAFLPDREESESLKPFKGDQLHLTDAVRILAKEMQHPGSADLSERMAQLEAAASVEMSVISPDQKGEVVGLQNPLNSKICYLNSLVQILLPISPLVQVLSMSLSHGSAGTWTTAIARAARLFFKPAMGVNPSLLTVAGMDAVIKELGGIGTQQDVAEALGIVLNKLHEEWKHCLRKQVWESVDCGRAKTPTNHGLEEDSIVYKLFRGIRSLNNQLEIFTEIHLAPPAGGVSTTLVDLLKQTLQGELHYLPPVLCIELSRHLSENQLTTSQTSVPFSGSMTIPALCCTGSCNVRKYELVGAVVRSGVYANSGHFWAAQRRGNKWFWINDTEVSECDVTSLDQNDDCAGLISKKLDAASNWCVLVYADPEAKVAIHPYN